MDRPMKGADVSVPVVAEAEQALIGSLLVDNTQAWMVRGRVRPEDFYEPRNATIYRAILACLDDGKSADLVMLSTALQGRTGAPAIGLDQVVACMEIEISGVRAADYAELVRDAADRRRLVAAARGAIETASKSGMPIGETLRRAESSLLQALGSRSCPNVHDANSVMAEVLAELAAPADHSCVLPTGYADIDKMLGGLQPGAVYVIAARPGMGKSSLMTSLAQNVAIGQGHPVLLFSLEVSRKQVLKNIACAVSHVPNTAVRNRTVDATMKTAWAKAVETVRAAPIHIDDTPTLRAAEIRSSIRIECARRRVRLAAVDYLQLAGSDGRSESREREVAEICATLKQAARENEIPILVLSQLNRAAEGRKDKRPKISDLRESGAIEQDADAVLLLHRADYYVPQKAGTDNAGSETTVCIAKNRNGPTGLVTLLFFPAWARFESAAWPEILMQGAATR